MRSKKWMAVLVGIAMTAAVAAPVNARAEEPVPTPEAGQEKTGETKEPEKPAEGKLEISSSKPAVYDFKDGKSNYFSFEVENKGDVELNNVKVAPVMDTAPVAWPFDNVALNEGLEKVCEKLLPGQKWEVTYSLKAGENAPTGDYTAEFLITSEEGVSTAAKIRTSISPKPKEEEKTEKEEPREPSGPSDQGQSISNNEPITSGGGGETPDGVKSVPRVIVTGFSTEPASVTAGGNFKLIIHLQNTSKATAVSNMLFDLQAPTEGSDANTSAPAFLPASGSSSIFLDKIAAGGAKDISIDLNARGDLVQKPYSIAMSMKYEDSSKTQFEGASGLSIPVKQAARFEFSDFEITPEMIAIGEEGNVSCSLYNLGRTKLYNVKAKFIGTGISAKDVFVGNVESGASASIDGMIKGEKETPPDNQVKMVVTYEDEAGTLATTEKEFKLPVTAMAEDAAAGMMMQGEPVQGKKFPVIPVAAGAVGLAAVAAGIIIFKKKKKKALVDEEGELADEIDRPSENELQ